MDIFYLSTKFFCLRVRKKSLKMKKSVHFMERSLSSGGSAEAINKIAREDSGDECDGAAALEPRESSRSPTVEVDIEVSSLEKSKTGSLEIIPENCPLDPNGRLSISLDDQVSLNRFLGV